MPYARPTLSDLRTQVAQQIAAALPGSDPLLRTSVLKVLGDVTAAGAHLQYGYLDWIAQQSNPFTAADEFLEAWAALKSITRLAATKASGTVTFSGTNGTVMPSGTVVVRGDGWRYTTTAPATVTGGVVTAPAQADAGATGNADNGTLVNLFGSIVGINSSGVMTSAFTGGADVEDDDSLRARMLQAYQNPARGGSKADYIRWAREVAGVTRAWCLPHADGAGTVAMYVMLDVAQSVHDGFPQGANGAAAGETRAAAATGDQLTVANYLFGLQPVTHLVKVYAPAQNPVNFTITGLSLATTATQNAVKAAIKHVLVDQGSVDSVPTTVQLSYVLAAIAAVPNTTGFVVTSPASNITSAAGTLPVLGTVAFP